jgi:hypothetical protein
VGAQDNFFALGGDSITSIRVISRLREALAVDVSPRAVFSHPTVAALAATLPPATLPAAALPAAEPPAAPGSALGPVPARADGRPVTVPLSFAQQRLWFLAEFEPGSTEYVTSVALRLRGVLDLDALNVALTALVARHESLRTTFDSLDGRGTQVVHPPHEVRVPVLDLSSGPAAAREAEVLRLLGRSACARSTCAADRWCGCGCCGWAPRTTCWRW